MKTVESLGFHSEVYTPLMQRLLQHDTSLDAFHSGLFDVALAQQHAKKRVASFKKASRTILVESLRKQYADIPKIDATEASLQRLAQSNTVTVTTGHQLNIFTGPLFFWYKILDVINAVERLQKEDTKHDYVPIFWMASEDHDVEEINHFFLGEQKAYWQSPNGGPVGRMTTETLQKLHDELSSHWKTSATGKELLELFASCYLDAPNLASATRKLVHKLFGEYGLLVIDGDDPDLKTLFSPAILDEFSNKVVFNAVSRTDNVLKTSNSKYTSQVNPREINVFYILGNKRVRIEKIEQGYATTDGEHSWSLFSLEEELKAHPERFSPNALMRPLYQEIVLPNITYVGGGGELAYWLQLKNTFESFNIPYPLLKHRSSVLLMSEKQVKKCKKLELSLQDLFLPKASFINKRVRQISDIDIDFTPQREVLQQQFDALKQLAQQTDASFLNAVNAQERKQLNGLNALEKRLLKAQRIKLQDQIIRISDVQNELFPNGKLQERITHFSSVLKDRLIKDFTNDLKDVLDDASNGLRIVVY